MSWEYLRVVVVARVRRGDDAPRARNPTRSLETDEADVVRAMRRPADARAALDRCA